MTRERKVDLLYRKAKGQSMDATSEEMRELRKYKIDSGEVSTVVSKANIRKYVSAVDGGYRMPYYDWCMNNGMADRRRRGSSRSEMASVNRQMGLSSMLIGWLTWGIAIYWMFHGGLSVGICAVAGAVVALVLGKCARKWGMFTLVLLPIILAAVFGTR